MNSFYTERNHPLAINNPIYYKTVRLNPYNIFRNFLIKENSDSASKHIRYKKKEILPDYSNIRRIINSHIRDVKKFYDIKNTVFKEIKSKDIIAYSKFAKNMTLYFFGPLGKVTQNNKQFKRIFNVNESGKKVGLNSKIYAGKWYYYDDSSKNRYMSRLKSNRKKILNVGGNFTTDDDLNSKIHGLYLRSNKIKPKDEKINAKKRRFSTITDIKQISLFNNKNFFEYTSIEPYGGRKKSIQFEGFEKLNDNKSQRRHTIFTLPNVFKRTTIISNKTESNDSYTSSKRRKKIKKYDRNNLKTIKNIFLREKIERKLNKESRNHYKKLKKSLNTKLNDIMKPSKALLTGINIIKQNNETFFTHRNNNNKYKEDIKVIGEDDKREKSDNMKKFVKENYRNKLFNKNNASAPRKIHFSYYDKSKDNIHNSIKEFIKDIGKMKEEERERKYGKNIRQQFKANSKIIEKLGMNLDNLKSIGNI